MERADRGAGANAFLTTPTIRTTATTSPTRAAAPASSPGRITGLAADNNGDVYAAGADGGVWRSTTGGGNWTPIADSLPSLSSGDLELAPDGSLWYATGEANTGGTSYAGTGVYRLAKPTTGTFSPAEPRRRQRARVDHDQLDPVHLDRRVGRDAPRSVLPSARQLLGRVDAAPPAEPELPPRRRRTPVSRTRRT